MNRALTILHAASTLVAYAVCAYGFLILPQRSANRFEWQVVGAVVISFALIGFLTGLVAMSFLKGKGESWMLGLSTIAAFLLPMLWPAVCLS